MTQNMQEVNQQLYGEPLSWNEVKKIFPRYVEVTLVDVETGKRFRVVRRGGTHHADIQPLSAHDTRVLLEIFNGQWSWRRRAVVMETGWQRIAGSINGMPHGAGKIQGNDFPGHFCIHFLDSRVHQSGKVDDAHQLMVWKAAGRPEMPFLEAGPEKVLELVLIALNQQDGALASLGLSSSHAGMEVILRSMLGEVPTIALEGMSLVQNTETSGERACQIRVSLLYPGETGRVKRNGEITLSKDNPSARWLVKGEDLKEILFPERLED